MDAYSNAETGTTQQTGAMPGLIAVPAAVIGDLRLLPAGIGQCRDGYAGPAARADLEDVLSGDDWLDPPECEVDNVTTLLTQPADTGRYLTDLLVNGDTR
jgi:hypothetical protein